MRIPNKFNGYSADNRRIYNDPATITATLATMGEVGATEAAATAVAASLPEIAATTALTDFVGATGASGIPDALAQSIAAQSTASGLTGLPGLLEGASMAQLIPFGAETPIMNAADFTQAELFNPLTEASTTDPLMERQPFAHDIAREELYGPSKTAASSSGTMGKSLYDDLRTLVDKPNISNIKAFANENPKTAMALALMGLKLMQPKTPQVAAAPQYIRPYQSTRAINPNANPYRPYSGAPTSERTWFTGGLEALPPYKAASGGLASFAVGGPVETMSAMNAVGQNLGYPQSQFQTDIYSNPNVQRPQAMNMIAPSGDVAVDPYTGEEKFASGGLSHLGGYSDGGRLLRGPGDGVSDSIPASIGNRQPARLADGEFVVPARIVSELGNGSTEAGARKLYAMMDRVQKARKKSVGKDKVAVNSRADKHLPA